LKKEAKASGQRINLKRIVSFTVLLLHVSF
jgi:hypothetical protein